MRARYAAIERVQSPQQAGGASGPFGAQRVAAESWRTSSLRDATIRLVRTGMAMSNAQYRRLLGYKGEE